MSALTRILNNQIYSKTIIASQKIADGTITGSLFSSNVTVPGDFLITGNLFVLGSSSYTTIASTNTYVNDPLVVLNNGFSGTNTYDEGLIFNRGTSTNQAIIWSEAFGEFRLISTAETGTTYGNVNSTGLVRLSVGSLNVPGTANIGTIAVTNVITASSLNLSGNLLASTSIAQLHTGSTATFGNVAAVTVGNVGTQFNGAAINLSGNVLATAGVFNALTVNGNETVTGYLNVTGNVMAAVVTASQINTTGNVLATGGVYNLLTVNGNIATTGQFATTRAGNAGDAGGQIFLNGATSNRIDWAAAGTGAPAYINRTPGTKVVLYPALSGSTVDYAIGIDNATLWSSVPENGGSFNFKWYGGDQLVANLSGTGNFTTSGAVVVNSTDASSSTATGALIVKGGAGVAGALYVGSTINTAGNVLAAAGTFSGLTVNGNESVTGYLNVTGNVLASAGVFNALTVNGNETVTGYLNVTGNILGATGTLSVLGVSNTLWANSSTATTTQGTGALIVPTGGISVAGAANIAGAATIGGAVQLNNTLSVGGLSYYTNTTNATEATGASGALQIKGGASVAKDLYVGGNIYASNIYGTSYQVITVKDPLLYLDAANTFPYNYDIGFYSNFVGPNPLDNTGNVYQHSGVVRDNADNTWKFFSNVRTEPSGAEITFDVNTIYDPVRAGNLVLTYTQAATSTTTGALQVGGGAGIAGALYVGSTINTAGNVLAAAGTFSGLTVNGNESVTGYLNVTGNVITAQLNAGQINTTGNVLATAGVFNALTVNGNESVTGYLNVTGNVMAAVVTASQLNTAGNVLAQAGVFNGLTVNGNESVTGYLNVTGNVLATRADMNVVAATGIIWANSSTKTTTATGTGALVIPTGGASVGGNVYIGENLYVGPQTPATAATAAFSGIMILAAKGDPGYVQIAAGQNDNRGSTDFAAYASDSSDASGWVDMGFTGNAFSDSNYSITKPHDGYLIVKPKTTYGGNLVLATSNVGVYNDVVVGVGNFTSDAEVARFHGNVSNNGNLRLSYATVSTTPQTGALTVVGGVGAGGNLRVGGGAVINSAQTHDNFVVMGAVSNGLIYADVNNSAVTVGSGGYDGTGTTSGTTLGASFKVDSKDSMMIPVGTTAERPGASANVAVAGMVRFNTTITNLEFYDGTNWQAAGSTFTVISDRQFSGTGPYGNVDGVNTTFTIQATATTSSTIVSINGVIQFPVLAYGVSGTTLTFTEAPAVNDVVDVRVLATTSVVSTLANGNGLNQFIAADTGAEIWSGTSSTTKRINVDPVGNFNFVTGNKVTYDQTAVNIPSTGTPTQIDTWSQTAYTSAKYHITAKVGSTRVETYELLVLTDGSGNAYVTTYGVVNNGTAFGSLSAVVTGGNVIVKYSSTIAQANVKAFGTFIV